MHLKSKTRLPVFIIAGLIGTLLTGVYIIYFLQQRSSATDTQTPAPLASMFDFTGSGGWRQGPSNESSMALFSPAASDGTSACFTSIEYYGGEIDINAEIEKDEQQIKAGGNSITPLGIQSMIIRTPAGEQQYELHQLKITSSGSASSIMGGHEIGFVQLQKGYLKIYGNCNTAEQLPSTIPALKAYKLNKTL